MLFDPSEEYTPGSGLLAANFECDGRRYSVHPASNVYRRLSLRPLNAAAMPAVYDLSTALPSADVRLMLRFTLALGDAFLERTMSNIAIRYSMMLADNANQRARNSRINFFSDGTTLLAIFNDVFVEEPYRLLPPIGTWLSKDPDDQNYEPVESRAPLDLQHAVVLSRHQLPTTGALRYVGSSAGDGRVHQLPPQTLAAALADDCNYVQHERRREGEHTPRAVIRRNLHTGIKLAIGFQRMAARMLSGRAGLDPGAEAQRKLDEQRAVYEYTQRIEQTMSGIVNLGDGSVVWAPGTTSTFMDATYNALREDLACEARNNYVFVNLRAYLNTVFARERHPGVKVWIKVPKRDDDADGTDIQETTIAAFLKNHPLSVRLPAPDDPVDRKKLLRDNVVRCDKETNEFDVLEWYVHFGARQVNGLRYWPLHQFESLGDVGVRDWVNTFRGFRCTRWIREFCSERVQYGADHGIEPALLRDHAAMQAPDSDLAFYLQHLKNLCCGSDEARELVLTWFALLCFYPREKPDTWILFVGRPGCGKTSSTTKFAEHMLNKAHTRIVKDMIGLVGHFNADAGNTSLTVIEEMDFKDQKQKALNALQGTSLLSCAKGTRTGATPADVVLRKGLRVWP